MNRGIGLAVLVAFLASAAPTIGAPTIGAPSDPLQAECDYGITLALGGQDAKAESVFISLLSHAPGDARALNNLGNVALLRGRAALAASFYARAAQADSADAGIVLNQATAYTVLDDEESALAAATEGLRRAGGPGPAADLLGLRYDGDAPDWAKGDRRGHLSKEEVLALLRAAAGKVPVDSTRARSAGKDVSVTSRPPAWRSAGPRAAHADVAGEGGAGAVVYWKR